MPEVRPQDSIQERISGFWSAVADGYEAHGGNVEPYGTPGYQEWVRVIGEALPPAPSDVLDVGCGTGFASLIAAGLGHRVTGVDLAAPMLAEARANAARLDLLATFEPGDAVNPDFPANRFDVVMNRHLYWTLRDPEAAFANWRRLLRDGGRVAIIDGFWFDETPRDGGDSGEPNIFDEHYDGATKAQLPGWRFKGIEPLERMLHGAGFGEVSVKQIETVTVEGRTPFLVIAR